MKILVDADACPRGVLKACQEAGRQYGIEVWTVANYNHVIESEHHITVGNSAQEADVKLMNLAQQGDIVITQDWGLAAMLLGKGALVLSPLGKEYTEQKMDFMLEEREAKAKFRRGGGRTPGPKKRNVSDDQRFTANLIRLIRPAEMAKKPELPTPD
ncbi:MAG: YaiI/YqxD family protein [Methylocystaceae bacterium]